MSGRKIWDGNQWIQIGGSVNDVVPITQVDYDALTIPDASTMYVITDSTGAALSAQSFRVNQRLIQKIMVGSSQLWQPAVFATGGTITDIDVAGVMWRVHTFTATGQFEVLETTLDVEYLVVSAGGGGGKSAVGLNAVTTTGGSGGAGFISAITGSSVTYCGGGGGGSRSDGVTALGGSGVGGRGSGTSGAAQQGTDYTGSGGGGGNSSYGPARGGHGIIVLRYQIG